ncbi:TIGR04219 family outer membrane beta-barrel protein [Photobacterium sp. SDRW27]|uniref:TIGR04219 family outer membrane beta-barrel protein n=1 Tax=Photobacterium obscurum TaxID=2829490 RepID=UPI002244D058|nr:TIGR04219 family outer membrane beta-barrel protein [Photobacterium obscurum]MCW8328714.1 TIGR04219 family outer membrane beta-barrel protein [Photobacterium obscurum]
MKKTVLAALLTTAPFMASADVVLGGDVEVNMWQQTHNFAGSEVDGDDTSYTFEASLEHILPLIPNFKLGQSSVDNDDYSYTKRDYTLYYEFLDNDLVSVDAGVGITEFTDGELNVVISEDFSGFVPHLYAAAEVGIPMTPLFVFAKGSGIGYGDNNLIDASVGIQYSIGLYAFDLELQAGYRVHQLDLEDFDDLSVDLDAKTDGLFAGVNFDF